MMHQQMKKVPDDVIDLKVLAKKLTDIAENHITDLERLKPLQAVISPLVEIGLRC